MRIVRLGSKRARGEGLRIETVRRPPHGVRKEDFAAKNIYDVWYPNLAPSETLLKEFRPIESDGDWRSFKRQYLAEIKQTDAKRSIELLAALSHHTALSVGCYCEDESRCHRPLLRELLAKAGPLLH